MVEAVSMGIPRGRRKIMAHRVGRTLSKLGKRTKKITRLTSSQRRKKSRGKKPVKKLFSAKTKQLFKDNQLVFRTVTLCDKRSTLVDTSKNGRLGKYLPGQYMARVAMNDDKEVFGEVYFTLQLDAQSDIIHKPSETVVQIFNEGKVQKRPSIKPPPPLPPIPKQPPPPLPKHNQPDNSVPPIGYRDGHWKVVVSKVRKTELPILPPTHKLKYDKTYIFRVVPMERNPKYLWIKRFLGNPDVIEGFSNDIEVRTPSPPLGIERGDHVFLAEVDKSDTVWRSYEGAAKYFISKKPRNGHILLTDLKVNDITDVPLIREDFERNIPNLPKGYAGGKGGEVNLDLYESTEDVVFAERGDKGHKGEVPVSPNVLKWALPTTHKFPIPFNLDQEEFYGAESLGLSGTAGSEDDWAYMEGRAKDIKERKAIKRFGRRHPKRIFRRIRNQQRSVIRRIELKHGKLSSSTRRSLKKSLSRKRAIRRIAIGQRKRNRGRRNVPFWKRGGRTIYGKSKLVRRGPRHPFRRGRQRRGRVVN